MALNEKELNKLSPEERLKKLKQLEEERKKEASKIDALIKKSMQELKTVKLADDFAPKQKDVDISKLFEQGQGNELERTAKNEAREADTPLGQSKSYFSLAQMYDDYSQLKKFHGYIVSGQPLTEEQLGVIGTIGERLVFAEKYSTQSEKISNLLNPSRQIIYRLKKDTGLD